MPAGAESSTACSSRCELISANRSGDLPRCKIQRMQPATTPFGFDSTTDEVLQGVDLHGKRAVVTGATSGLGVETARALAAAGAEVVLGVRRLDAGMDVAEELRRVTGNDAIEAAQLDLTDLGSVAAFVRAWNGPLHMLINNAGVMAIPELQRSALGCEMQFASNFLGHFALVSGLHEALAAAGGARVVSVSSTGHLFSPSYSTTCTTGSGPTIR